MIRAFKTRFAYFFNVIFYSSYLFFIIKAYIGFLVHAALAVGCALLSVEELCNVYKHSFRNTDKKCKYCNKTKREDEDNSALNFANETYLSFCCKNCKVILDLL